ncbi:hypothetical protein CHS0354_026621 [Potamilus streckersoni]|uniref:Protein kinase domain-containing protein n=1 Tax=Potamilus streckersoni TaxID=2493646 RepID=A0AAE0VXA3_9BIVA|nr:hypothetical protein CHS0354_026621 [Potamilus streckersoni]
MATEEIEWGKGSIRSRDDILKIPDIKSGFRVLDQCGLSKKGLRSLDDIKKLLVDFLDKNGNISSVHHEESYQQSLTGIQKATEDDKFHREKLVEYYNHVNNFYQSLPKEFQLDLGQIFPDIETSLKKRPEELRTNECTILVAGEIAAGKSSFINLMLGIDLLPTSQLPCTATVCEIRRAGDRKEAIVYPKSGDSGKVPHLQPALIDLSSEKGKKTLKDLISQVDDNDDCNIDRIEIYWPLTVLEEGIVIVDTPGIGRGNLTTQYLQRYLKNSFGFIYIINSTNAGGVQKGRLQTLLRQVVNSAGVEGFNPESTMFVINRWDQIGEQDKEILSSEIWNKLRDVYPGLREDQLFFVSITEAQKALLLGTKLENHAMLQKGLEKLFPDSLRNRLKEYYRWMATVIKRSLYSLKMARVNTVLDKEKMETELDQISKQMDKIQHNAENSIATLRENFKTEVSMVKMNVLELLRSKEFEEDMMRWTERDCPRGKDEKKVCREIEDRISDRLAILINGWESQQCIVRNIKQKVIKYFKRDFQLMEDQLLKVEAVLLGGDTGLVRNLHESMRAQQPATRFSKTKSKQSKGTKEEFAHSVKGLGGAIASAGGIDIKDKLVKSTFKKYLCKEGFEISLMQEATALFLESLSHSKELDKNIYNLFSRFTKEIDQVAKMMPEFLKADKEMIKLLRSQMQDADKNLKEILPDLLRKGRSLQGEVDIFYVENIMKFDYELEDLEWDRSKPRLGKGSFADVYLAKIIKGMPEPVPVALKVCRDSTAAGTVTDILLEDATLRTLKHDNIIKYYGATYKPKGDRTKAQSNWIMIMEVCEMTLKEVFLNGEEDVNPGKFESESSQQVNAMKQMSKYAVQMCSGLGYLHEKGFVHRDLKLENVLVRKDGVVKLTDVGLAKPQVDISATMAGSPVYMAPEVLKPSQPYDYKADIYSLAIVTWEMWYGVDAADHISVVLFGSIQDQVSRGLRPSLSMKTKPGKDIEELICRSWSNNPKERPDISEHEKFFRRFL